MPYTTRRRARLHTPKHPMLDALESRVLLTAVPVLPTVSIVVSHNASEIDGLAKGSGLFTVSRKGGSNAGSLTINYSVGMGSTATAGVDYQALSGQVIIPAGKPSVTIPVLVNDDGVAEPTENVIVVLSADAAYTLNPVATKQVAQMSITDSSSTVSITKTKDGSEVNGSTTGAAVFTISRKGGDMSHDLTVTYDSSTGGGPQTVIIPAKKPSVKVTVPIVSSPNYDPAQVLTLTLDADPSYHLDANPLHVHASAKVKQALIADLFNIGGFDTGGSSWNYNVKASDGPTGTEAATNTVPSAGHSVWDGVVTPVNSSFTPISQEFAWTSDGNGLHLTQLVTSVEDIGISFDFAGLLVSPPILNGSATADSAVTVNFASSPDPLTGTAHCVTKVVGPAHVVVPAGTFNALQIKMTISFNATGTSTSIKGTVNATLYVAPGVGIVKLVETTSASGHFGRNVSAHETFTSQLTSFNIGP